MTAPDVRISHEPVFQSPLGPEHFFPGKRRTVAVGQLADDGTGGTLKAAFQVFAALGQDILEESPVWLDAMYVCHVGDTL
jgi:hypothetical protein